MLRNIPAAMFVLTALLASEANAQAFKMKKRCEEDNLDPTEAIKRVDWYLENYFEDARIYAQVDLGRSLSDSETREYWVTTTQLDAFGKPRAKPLYPTFGNANSENPLNYFAPPPTSLHPNPGAVIPEGYDVMGLCTSSCYKPQVPLRFATLENGEAVYRDVAIASAVEQGLSTVAVLADNSTLEKPIVTTAPVDSYTISATPTSHAIYVLTGASGKSLEVTDNHPLVDATGRIREAGTFAVGDALVTLDGELEPIRSIHIEPFFGRVYNLAPRSASLLGNVVIANGFLSGSSWYQNDGVDNLNRKLLRRRVPREITR